MEKLSLGVIGDFDSRDESGMRVGGGDDQSIYAWPSGIGALHSRTFEDNLTPTSLERGTTIPSQLPPSLSLLSFRHSGNEP